MDLVKYNNLPIKAIPEQDLNRVILTQFTVWVANLLSLTDEVSAKRLETSLPAIKEHCWSMGFEEIKKMFEMYVDNKLSIKPIPNYFDRILFGKIVSAYKEQKPIKKKTMIDQDQQKLMYDKIEAIKYYDSFIQMRKLDDNAYWVYTFLADYLKIIEDADKTKIFAYNRAMEQIKGDRKSKEDHEQAVNLAKVYLLRQYFERIEAKGQHLKDLI